jgi:electron transfer flavoprotein beta subunit
VKIAVCLKQVPATDSRIKPSGDGKAVDLTGIEWVVNPYDEFALEEALRLKEKYPGEVVVLSIGGDKVEEAMRSALALGADRAVVLKDPAFVNAEPLAIAEALAAMAKRESPDLVLCGKQGVDHDRMAVPAMLAEKLDWPQATVVVKLEMGADGKTAHAEREVEGGHEEIEIALPAVIAAQKGLNEPRYANLKGIMAAKKKPVAVVTAQELGLSAATNPVLVLEVSQPSQARKNRMLSGDPAQQVEELIRILRTEEKIL